jgi:hypothetical protein
VWYTTVTPGLFSTDTKSIVKISGRAGRLKRGQFLGG